MIDIPDEAVVVGARALSNQRGDACESQALREHFASLVLTAAAPHLRAAWEQEMAEKVRAKFLGPDFGRNPVNGQDSPDAALHAAYDEGLHSPRPFGRRRGMSFEAELEEAWMNGEISHQEACEIAEEAGY